MSLYQMATWDESGGTGHEARNLRRTGDERPSEDLSRRRTARDAQRWSRQADRLRHLAGGRFGFAALSTEDAGHGQGIGAMNLSRRPENGSVLRQRS